jgi:xylulose-5-phosphate/fructose-6-phosphate phosphoketolase
MSANPVANGGLLRKSLDMPDFRTLGVDVKKPGTTQAGNAGFLGVLMREVMRLNKDNFRLFGPDESQSTETLGRREVKGATSPDLQR